MDFFTLLRDHARTRAEAMAVSSLRRSMTYRKLWSRIERATARLQQEWEVRKGDTVAYYGHSHPDALVLYFALARCSARLLPLAAPLSHAELGFFAQEFRLRLLLRDDELALPIEALSLPVRPLSALIEKRCPHEPTDLPEDPHHASLVLWSSEAGVGKATSHSLAQLWEKSTHARPGPEERIHTLFREQTLSDTVLPLLQRGGILFLP